MPPPPPPSAAPVDFSTFEETTHLGTGAQGRAVLIRGLGSSAGVLAVSKQIALSNLAEDVGKVHNEVKVLAALKHPHIVAYLGSFERPGELCIILSLIHISEPTRRS
eukprot:7390743-Prymnesium_polylepis.1